LDITNFSLHYGRIMLRPYRTARNAVCEAGGPAYFLLAIGYLAN
jgi:hypothetical protein